MDLTNILNGREGLKIHPTLRSHPPLVHHSRREVSQHPPTSPSTPPAVPYAAALTITNAAPLNNSIRHGNLLPTMPPAPNIASKSPGRSPYEDPSMRAYPCSACSKQFARRSDLARHERIHTGIRPHVCDWAGCNKRFIQRSALTVHSRVHTGEKPHICETCTKPFSDSSSLARHRRIHSGKRPYKCPYADCQKTFTRRTTLTRHQNHHTGPLSEPGITVAVALASRPTIPKLGRFPESPTLTQAPRSIGEDNVPQLDTPSPLRRPASLLPGGEVPPPLPPPSYAWQSVMWPQGVTSHPAVHELQPLTPRTTPSSTPTIPSVVMPQPQLRCQNSYPSQQPPLPSLPEVFESHSPTDTRDQGSSSPHPSSKMSPHGPHSGWHSPHHHTRPTSQPCENDYFYSPLPNYFQPSSRPSSSDSVRSSFAERSNGVLNTRSTR